MKQILLCVLLLFTSGLRAENIVFPEGENVVLNVKTRFGARGDGLADDTAALQKALNAASESGPKIVYLPNGTYKISDTLRWAGRQTRVVLQGQSQNGTIIKLTDRAHTFTDPTAPKEMIWTGTFPPQRFRNAIRNLTVDAGSGNAGAIGVRFNASNQGILREVTIRSGDGRGVIGLDMGYVSDVGPLMVKNLHVHGFDVGIYTAYGVAGQALENITLEKQNFYGWINDGQAISIRNLQTRLAVPALLNKRIGSFVTLLDSRLQGENALVPAIINNAAMLARNVQTPGYKMAIDGAQGNGRSEAGLQVTEYVSQPVLSQFPGPARTLNLPIQETPDVPWDDPQTWVSVAQFAPEEKEYTDARGRKQKTKDYTASLQKAIDSGATTIYFPQGSYAILGKVFVRGRVQRIIGLENAFQTLSGVKSSAGEWIIEDGEAPVVKIERFDWIYSNPLIRVRTKRPVVISSIPGARIDAGPGSNVFLEDVVAMFRVQKGANLWARQFNTEYTDEERNRIEDVVERPPFPGAKAEWPGNLNEGGNLWVFGIKTEGDGIIISTTDGGKTEVLGGVIYANKNTNPDKKLFVSENSAVSYSIKEFVSRNQPFNSVVETRGGETKTLKAVPGGIMMVLYSGIPGEAAPEKIAPTAPLPAGTGTGLKAEYFADANFTSSKATRTDATIDFDWTNNAPEGLNLNAYSVRWSGFVEPQKTGTYNFPLSAEGMRLMIDGRLVATSWHPPVRYRFGAMYLEAGKKYAVKLERRAVNDKAKITFAWQPPGEGAAPVPTSQMYPATQSLPEVTISASANTISENGAPIEIKLSRNGDLSQPLTVNLAPRVDAGGLIAMKWALRGSAVAGIDYEPLPETITFAAGQKEAALRFVPLDDKQPEPEKTALFDLEFAPHFNARSGPVTIKLQDDDLPPLANGSGLKAEYFDDNALKELKGTRVDSQVNFDWDKAAPLAGIVTQTNPRGPHGFSARWTGQIQPLFSETYKFELDMGAYSAGRLWINNQLVVDAWEKNSLRSGTIALKAGQKYEMKLEYDSQNFYAARVRLLWSSPSQWEQPVPASQLFPAP
jgi:hypothetical protein